MGGEEFKIKELTREVLEEAGLTLSEEKLSEIVDKVSKECYEQESFEEFKSCVLRIARESEQAVEEAAEKVAEGEGGQEGD